MVLRFITVLGITLAFLQDGVASVPCDSALASNRFSFLLEIDFSDPNEFSTHRRTAIKQVSDLVRANTFVLRQEEIEMLESAVTRPRSVQSPFEFDRIFGLQEIAIIALGEMAVGSIVQSSTGPRIHNQPAAMIALVRSMARLKLPKLKSTKFPEEDAKYLFSKLSDLGRDYYEIIAKHRPELIEFYISLVDRMGNESISLRKEANRAIEKMRVMTGTQYSDSISRFNNSYDLSSKLPTVVKQPSAELFTLRTRVIDDIQKLVVEQFPTMTIKEFVDQMYENLRLTVLDLYQREMSRPYAVSPKDFLTHIGLNRKTFEYWLKKTPMPVKYESFPYDSPTKETVSEALLSTIDHLKSRTDLGVNEIVDECFDLIRRTVVAEYVARRTPNFGITEFLRPVGLSYTSFLHWTKVEGVQPLEKEPTIDKNLKTEKTETTVKSGS